MSDLPNLATATAHQAWDERWRDEAGRADWLAAEADVRDIVAMLRARRARRVLDLGCGVGRHALALAGAGFEVAAIDGSESGIAHLHAGAAAQGLDIETRTGLMTDLPYPDADFDYVLSWNVIYHGDESVVRRSIAEIRRVLAPGGLYQGTMLSKRNDRFGLGNEVSPNTFVIEAEDDKSHPHFYCSAGELVALFAGFELFSLIDREHDKPGSWHWHMIAELV